ncbi:hypothetical protein Zmor_015605 [Zophobas morio]|uniref:DUF4371 domain-containing protein n=1 Tax=Zophobas morio TaxID=2755281 RepID=A0AA38INA6_9CUCU|nr:hypothetical protein Zmor_015605 [Zophobas morio]
MNSINNIKTLTEGKKLVESQKILLKRLGPPRPVDIIQTTVNVQTQKQETFKFDSKLYELTPWLCGCPRRGALFCYFCLVMNNGVPQDDDDDLWDSVGVTQGIMSPTELKKKVTKHQQSTWHKINTLNYLVVGESNLAHRLSRDYFFQIKKHNKVVCENQYALNVLIDCVKYNTGEFNFQHEMNKLKELNPSFGELLQNLEEDLLDSIHSVYIDVIREEIAQTDFVSIELNEAANLGSSTAIFIIRYELKGQIFERFLGFKTLGNKSFQEVSNVILIELARLGVVKKPHKLISYSHDLSISPDTKNQLHSEIKSVYKNVQFIYSYTHNFDLFVERTVWKFKEVKIFFGNLENIALFFTQSEKCVQALNATVERRLPRGYKISWNFDSQKLMTVVIHKDNIRTCINEIAASEVDPTLVSKAQALQTVLDNEDFMYWLCFFGKLMPACNDFVQKLDQVELCDVVSVSQTVETFKETVKALKKHTEKTIGSESVHQATVIKEEITVEENEFDGVVFKQEPPTSVSNEYDILLSLDPLLSPDEIQQKFNDELAGKICGVILDHLDDSFARSTYLYLSIAALVKSKYFWKYEETFPNTELNLAVSTFNNFNAKVLCDELNILYERQEMKQAESVLVLLQYFHKHSLHGAFAETSKLLKMVCTMPLITAEPGRCCKTFAQARTFFEKVQVQDNYDILAMCSLGKDLMQSTPDFNELVIGHFSSQSKRLADFTYKPLC